MIRYLDQALIYIILTSLILGSVLAVISVMEEWPFGGFITMGVLIWLFWIELESVI